MIIFGLKLGKQLTMKKISLLVLITCVIAACKQETNFILPLPTNGETYVKEDMENPEKSNAKKAWKKKLFRTPEGLDAEQIELQNSFAKFERRNTAISTRTPIEIIADGKITGEWVERGSKNQAGSVFVTEYDQETDELWLISAGAHLWKSNIDGFSWEVVNHNARFHNQFLDIVKTEDGSKRILSAISNMPHYSDDMGLTWTQSTGFGETGNPRIKNPFTVDDSLSYTYFLGQASSTQSVGLYVTKDKGVSYEKLYDFNTSDRRNLSLSITKNSNEIYVLEQISASTSRLHRMNEDQTQLELIEPFAPVSYNQGEGSFVSVFKDGITYLYALERSTTSNIHLSTNFGKTWEEKPALPSNPWGVGIFVSAEDPNFLMYGDIECYRSFDGGDSFEKINSWGDYYSDVVGSLHADMMYFSEYTDEDSGEHFMLISNHGGISKLDEFGGKPLNISLTGLNVSQYYSVRTGPDEEYVYAGSQDQGFQRTKDKPGEIMDFGQAISGDYGHIVFTKEQHLWTVYPGGWVSYWPVPHNSGISLNYTVESSNESVWIPPLHATEGSNLNQILMAGGNVDGGTGSYLIRLFATSTALEASQFDYDFRAASSGGVVSAIATGDEFDETIYVATDNGRFFYSHDYGDTFNKTAVVNGGHYLYGQVIIPSKLNSDKIYTGGNGYNGIPVMRSTDGGETFEPFGDGLPNTTVLGMALNEDESLLFAATTSGPYVCVLADYKWYDMSGEAAPDVTYWSVELVNDDNTVRFGTYGRGIYDFNISEFVNTQETALEEELKANVYPNPIADFVTIEWPLGAISDAAIFDLQGRYIQSIKTTENKTWISLANLSSGQYYLRYNHNNTIKSQTIIKL